MECILHESIFVSIFDLYNVSHNPTFYGRVLQSWFLFFSHILIVLIHNLHLSTWPWPVPDVQVSVDGMLCCTISNDRSVKIYDVVNYDMMAMVRVPFIPGCVEWVYKQGDVKYKLAISDRNSSFVHIYDARSGSNEAIISREVV